MLELMTFLKSKMMMKKKKKPKQPKSNEFSHDYEILNKAKPIWMRKADEITKDEYMFLATRV
jgi:HSP90 family molecular chaperone